MRSNLSKEEMKEFIELTVLEMRGELTLDQKEKLQLLRIRLNNDFYKPNMEGLNDE